MKNSFHASTIFFDIDETLVTASRGVSGHTIRSTLIAVVAKANRIGADEAHAKVLATFDPETETVDAHYAALGITPRQLWDALRQWMAQDITPFADAVETIPRLQQRGFRLFTCTTNSNLICRIKLAVAGLGGFDGSPHFESLVGGSEVHPLGKTTPAFYENLLKIAAARPDDVVHVGDDHTADLALAREAGIRQIALVRRDQTETCVVKDGAVSINSLCLLPEIITLTKT